jgi:glycosyltransferase involved in cell wall biosynthesis
MTNNNPKRSRVAILGTRGIPAAHGGFETFAERIALWLVARGWRVTVYCQEHGGGPIREDVWNGVERVIVPTSLAGAVGTMQFDWRCIRHAVRTGHATALTLGYNTALFCSWLRLHGVRNVINMDGLEWMRAKWRWHERAWLWINERAGCLIGNWLVADHPSIGNHLATRVSFNKIAVIPYGADRVEDVSADPLIAFGVVPGGYSCVIARPEPENSVLEIVRAFSAKPRDHKLLVFGKYEAGHPYHDAVRQAAGDEVEFVGPIYDLPTVASLRFHSRLYVHGHQVGGTNPSLVEALGAGSAILAHDNRFNRWVAQDAAKYFSNTTDCQLQFDRLLSSDELIATQRQAAQARHASAFRWANVLNAYESLLSGEECFVSQWASDEVLHRD